MPGLSAGHSWRRRCLALMAAAREALMGNHGAKGRQLSAFYEKATPSQVKTAPRKLLIAALLSALFVSPCWLGARWGPTRLGAAIWHTAFDCGATRSRREPRHLAQSPGRGVFLSNRWGSLRSQSFHSSSPWALCGATRRLPITNGYVLCLTHP